MSDYETSINKTDNTSDKAGGASAQVLPAEAGMDGGPVDKALAFAEHAGPINTDPVAMRKLLWRIDLMIMPIMMGCEFLNFLDKSSISYSALVRTFRLAWRTPARERRRATVCAC